ncbi:hypothetical protein GF357_02485 [Candidatus Dojkabacteria bacterium]|nr:hypothetical protein [Candidatus Dojkabacteria bacterium]
MFEEDKYFLGAVEITDGTKSSFYFTTSEFDGQLVPSSYRLVKIKDKKMITLIHGSRDLSNGYEENSFVTFSIYSLKYDEAEDRYLFFLEDTLLSKNKYNNIHNAFEKELGI